MIPRGAFQVPLLPPAVTPLLFPIPFFMVPNLVLAFLVAWCFWLNRRF